MKAPKVTKRKPLKECRRLARKGTVESYAAWCARVDSEVEQMAKQVGGDKPQVDRPPLYSQLSVVQRHLVELLINQLLNLPPLKLGDQTASRPQYKPIVCFVIEMATVKYGI